MCTIFPANTLRTGWIDFWILDSNRNFNSQSRFVMQQPLKVDLTNCDKEPIHIPGQIQSHGFLIAPDPDSLRITKLSANIVIIRHQNLSIIIRDWPANSLDNCFQLPWSSRVMNCLKKKPTRTFKTRSNYLNS